MLYLFRLFQTFIMRNPRYIVDGAMYANISNKYGYNMSKIVYSVDCKHHNYYQFIIVIIILKVTRTLLVYLYPQFSQVYYIMKKGLMLTLIAQCSPTC